MGNSHRLVAKFNLNLKGIDGGNDKKLDRKAQSFP
jgi:hypothetical protein